MIHNSSECSIKLITQELKKSEYGFLLFKDDGKKSMLSDLDSDESVDFHSKQKIEDIDIYFVPVKYNITDDNDKYAIRSNIEEKDFAINMIYQKWSRVNEKRPNKSPYKSKSFMEYIATEGITSSDYILIV